MTCDHRYITAGCSECEQELRDTQEGPAPTYTDDVIAVMRDTITALRQQVAELRQSNDELRRHAEALAAKFGGPRCELCGNGMARIGNDPWFCLLCPDEPEGVTP